MASSTGGKGQRKFGRGMRSPAHTRYVLFNTKRNNKIRRLKRHLRCLEQKLMRRPISEDVSAVEALFKLTGKRRG